MFFLIISRQISQYFILRSIIPVFILQVYKIEHLKIVSFNFIFNFLISISTSISTTVFLLKCALFDNFISISFNPLWRSLWGKKVLKMFTQTKNIHKKFNHFYKWPYKLYTLLLYFYLGLLSWTISHVILELTDSQWLYWQLARLEIKFLPYTE